MSSLKTIRNWKKRYCAGQKGSYTKIRAACKRYIDNMAKKLNTVKKQPQEKRLKRQL